MLSLLPEDIWSIIAPLLSIYDTGPVCCTCTELHRLMCITDRCVATAYAANVLGDVTFWDRASLRPKITCKKLASYRLEIARIENFKRVGRLTSLDAHQLYRLWTILDASAY